MYITIQIKPSSAGEGPQRLSGQLPADLQQAVQLGINILPMHPGATDPTLSRYFYVEVPDQPAAEWALAQLRKCSSVEAAFLKPPEGPP